MIENAAQKLTACPPNKNYDGHRDKRDCRNTKLPSIPDSRPLTFQRRTQDLKIGHSRKSRAGKSNSHAGAPQGFRRFPSADDPRGGMPSCWRPGFSGSCSWAVSSGEMSWVVAQATEEPFRERRHSSIFLPILIPKHRWIRSAIHFPWSRACAPRRFSGGAIPFCPAP